MLTHFAVFGLGLLCFVSAVPYQTRTIHIGPQDKVEDAMYLYRSMVASVAEYKAAKAFEESRAKLGVRSTTRDDHVCFGDLGCFFKNGTYGNFWMLPSSPKYLQTKFLLYTTADQKDPQLLEYDKPETLTGSAFRADWPTTVFMHGFGNGPENSWTPSFQAAIFHSIPQGNYIFVDWSIGARPPNYWAASANTQVVGAQVAKLIAALNTHTGTTSDRFHIVGYSLGAHAAGFTGHRLVQYGHKRAGRITGLDPAGPIFEDGHSDAILSSGDADFVAGLHANGATLTNGGFGLYKRVGDIDFYPNGGQYQPGCPHAIWGALGNLLTFNFGDMPESVKCNHHRVIELLTEALDPHCSHHSYACENWESFKEGQCDPEPDGNMGIFFTHTKSDLQHFLLTKDADGYCANAVKISLEIAATSEDSEGSLTVIFVHNDGRVETVEQLAKDEKLPAGKVVTEVVPSRFLVTDIAQIKIKYTPGCSWFWCSRDRINMERITVENLAVPGTKKCGGYEILYKEDVTTVDLSSCTA
ncbi:pancreatic lipase-related protein 2-like [Paramacrobiotus metropolitanus]|uniref:pancreatic lipase-related protein 2-like n=1 Tax=Paramacrobiotus metropolitanus TaxID=2943436 RepID=UPI002445C409|nr:pancreatic lipase-related protein 2-like [Paramacrobiotus metropolitanus]